jgi:flagellar biosynthesis/type III secretory pathway M-ring protein FliF/YscJ
MSGLVLVGLVMLRSLVKGLPTPEPLTAVANPTLTIAGGTGSTTNDKSESSEEEQEADEERPRLRLKKGTSLRDELTAIVKEDPDSAAAILRTWISNAS